MFEILPYTKELDSRLDHFVNQESVNGTFLQSRQFLNYHPEGRFKDASFAIHKSGTIAAYFPGNEITDESGKRNFISHQGSTFGGPVISKDFYKGSRVIEILKEADAYFSSRYHKVSLKIPPRLFCTESPDIIEYALEHLGYTRATELSSYTSLSAGLDPLDSCEKDCRRIFRNSEKYDLCYRSFNDGDLETFYQFLELSKAKHNVRPVHTLAELEDLKRRLNTENLERVRFRGIWLKERYIAGMMLFAFPNVGTLHAQYIAPDDTFKEFQPTTCLYVNILRDAAREGFKTLSWGISTEDHGNFLNEPLLRFKEAFGAKIAVNETYVKEFA